MFVYHVKLKFSLFSTKLRIPFSTYAQLKQSLVNKSVINIDVTAESRSAKCYLMRNAALRTVPILDKLGNKTIPMAHRMVEAQRKLSQ